MIFKIILISSLLVFTSFNEIEAAGKNVLCYYEGWQEDFAATDIDINICTHILYAFLGLKSDGTITGIDDNEYQINNLKNLKKKNGNLKLLLSVGGWLEGSTKFSNMVASSSARKKFLSDALNLINKYNFDGLDVDWEFPAERGGSIDDKKNFVTLLKELKSGLSAQGHLLTVAVTSQATLKGYDIPNINKHVDFINLMTYDFHDGSESKTAANAPLDEVEASANSWLDHGASPDKLILGLAFYGRSFTLADSGNYGYGASAVGEGKAGPDTGEDGYLSFQEICENSWTEEWSEKHSIPYRHGGNQWVGYDNPDSIRLKVNFAKSKNLAGVMMWAVDNDDKKGNCGKVNGLIKAIGDTI